jgi:hypothetical protein
VARDSVKALESCFVAVERELSGKPAPAPKAAAPKKAKARR